MLEVIRLVRFVTPQWLILLMKAAEHALKSIFLQASAMRIVSTETPAQYAQMYAYACDHCTDTQKCTGVKCIQSHLTRYYDYMRFHTYTIQYRTVHYGTLQYNALHTVAVQM